MKDIDNTTNIITSVEHGQRLNAYIWLETPQDIEVLDAIRLSLPETEVLDEIARIAIPPARHGGRVLRLLAGSSRCWYHGSHAGYLGERRVPAGALIRPTEHPATVRRLLQSLPTRTYAPGCRPRHDRVFSLGAPDRAVLVACLGEGPVRDRIADPTTHTISISGESVLVVNPEVEGPDPAIENLDYLVPALRDATVVRPLLVQLNTEYEAEVRPGKQYARIDGWGLLTLADAEAIVAELDRTPAHTPRPRLVFEAPQGSPTRAAIIGILQALAPDTVDAVDVGLPRCLEGEAPYVLLRADGTATTTQTPDTEICRDLSQVVTWATPPLSAPVPVPLDGRGAHSRAYVHPADRTVTIGCQTFPEEAAHRLLEALKA